MWFLDVALQGSFRTYGLRVLLWSLEEASTRADPMILLFPRYVHKNYASSCDAPSWEAFHDAHNCDISIFYGDAAPWEASPWKTFHIPCNFNNCDLPKILVQQGMESFLHLSHLSSN